MKKMNLIETLHELHRDEVNIPEWNESCNVCDLPEPYKTVAIQNGFAENKPLHADSDWNEFNLTQPTEFWDSLSCGEHPRYVYQRHDLRKLQDLLDLVDVNNRQDVSENLSDWIHSFSELKNNAAIMGFQIKKEDLVIPIFLSFLNPYAEHKIKF